jgi:hypothetical protein
MKHQIRSNQYYESEAQIYMMDLIFELNSEQINSSASGHSNLLSSLLQAFVLNLTFLTNIINYFSLKAFINAGVEGVLRSDYYTS